MGKVADLQKKREEKTPKCPFCNEVEHGTLALCPRVASVLYHLDGGIEYIFIVRDAEDGDNS